ncbi:hypothetical protein B0H10DRAFT_2210936 [Mycena sp. CBHHK59/15]|nr:hypothetical protein B0H10DRAFT_2210936 [Mycena sp. CBHHK59/15]
MPPNQGLRPSGIAPHVWGLWTAPTWSSERASVVANCWHGASADYLPAVSELLVSGSDAA